jgi:ribosomal-protein-serine acetyltransferase
MAVELRQLREEDAAALSRAVEQSLEQLRLWMPWAAGEPQPVAARAELIREWERERANGGDASFGIYVDGELAGACGLHRRIGEGGLEAGYWVRSDLTGRGVGTEAARRLCEIAFAEPGVDRLEIHHDRANPASGRIPARLGFELVGSRRDAPEAPGEEGVEIVWRLTRSAYARRKEQGPA